MFKINRNGSKGRYSTHSSLSSNRPMHKAVNSQKNILKKSLTDSSKLSKKITTEKINSFKRLTKQNIQQLNRLRHLKQKQIKNANKINSSLQQQINTNQKNLQALPKMPEYKPQITKIQQLPTRKIQSQEDMAKIFNSIMNGDDQNLPKPIQNPVLTNSGIVQGIVKQQKIENFEIDIDKTVLRLQQEILDEKNINYLKYIQIAFNLKKQFPKNTMIKSIIMRALDRHNRQQYYKIPDDKLKDVASIILQQIH